MLFSSMLLLMLDYEWMYDFGEIIEFFIVVLEMMMFGEMLEFIVWLI